MSVKAKALSGARTKLYLEDPKTGQYRLAGIFNSVSWGQNYNVEPVYILGRFNAAEQVYTGMDVISLDLSGFRVINNGPYKIGNAPQLQDLLNVGDFQLALVDRQTGESFLKVVGCVVNNWGSGASAKSLVDLRLSVTGISLGDEEGDQEDLGAVDFG